MCLSALGHWIHQPLSLSNHVPRMHLCTYLPPSLSIYLLMHLGAYWCISVPIYLSACRSIYLTINLYLNLNLNRYLYLYLCLSICPCIYLSTYVSINQSVNQPIKQSMHTATHLPFHLSSYLSARFLPLYPSMHPVTFLPPDLARPKLQSVYLTTWPFIYLFPYVSIPAILLAFELHLSICLSIYPTELNGGVRRNGYSSWTPSRSLLPTFCKPSKGLHVVCLFSVLDLPSIIMSVNTKGQKETIPTP